MTTEQTEQLTRKVLEDLLEKVDYDLYKSIFVHQEDPAESELLIEELAELINTYYFYRKNLEFGELEEVEEEVFDDGTTV